MKLLVGAHTQPAFTTHTHSQQDFVEMLPVPDVTWPLLGTGPLNLATALLPADNPTDLGPKTYIAYGR